MVVEIRHANSNRYFYINPKNVYSIHKLGAGGNRFSIRTLTDEYIEFRPTNPTATQEAALGELLALLKISRKKFIKVPGEKFLRKDLIKSFYVDGRSFSVKFGTFFSEEFLTANNNVGNAKNILTKITRYNNSTWKLKKRFA